MSFHKSQAFFFKSTDKALSNQEKSLYFSKTFVVTLALVCEKEIERKRANHRYINYNVCRFYFKKAKLLLKFKMTPTFSERPSSKINNTFTLE